MNDQNRTPLADAIEKFKERNPAYFCVPAHGIRRGADKALEGLLGKGILEADLTETPLTDDLHSAEGPIKEAEELASLLWGSSEAHFLINGSSAGVAAMIMAAAVPGQTICMARNAHRSALSGLILSGARPAFFSPSVIDGWEIPAGITAKQVKEALEYNPDSAAVLLVSPNYYGICSEIREIAEICHSRGIPLLVDEAHGAHLRFCGIEDAMSAGADACVQSLHKTMGSLTQSSIIHIQGNLIDRDRLRDCLRMLQSTSPSYPLMASLDIARRNFALNGGQLCKRQAGLAHSAELAISKIPGFRCFNLDKSKDPARLVISADELGISGFDLQSMLFDDYNIAAEMADEKNVVFVVSYANNEEDVRALTGAVSDISGKYGKFANSDFPFSFSGKISSEEPMCPPERTSSEDTVCSAEATISEGQSRSDGFVTKDTPAPKSAITPREAFYARKKSIPLEEALGTVCAEMIALYPPGIPVIYPGEIIDGQVLDFLKAARNRRAHVQGAADKTLRTVRIVSDD